MLDCLGWLLQKTCICFHTSPPAACLSQMRNKRRCVWSQNYLWAKRRPASRKTIRNSQPDTTILHSPTPFRKNPKNFWPLTGQNRPKWHMQSGYDMMIKSYRHIRMKGFRRMYQWYGLNYHSWRKYWITTMKRRIFVRPTFFYHTGSYILTTKTRHDLCPLGSGQNVHFRQRHLSHWWWSQARWSTSQWSRWD